MGRFLGVDYGTRRIGLACCDAREVIVSPAGTLPGTGSPRADAESVLKWADQNEIQGLVIGLPLNMDGSDSRQTRLTRLFVEEVRSRTARSVEVWDERLSSFQADAILNAAGVRRARRRELRDALAAQVILQSFLSARHRQSEQPEPPEPPAPADGDPVDDGM